MESEKLLPIHILQRVSDRVLLRLIGLEKREPVHKVQQQKARGRNHRAAREFARRVLHRHRKIEIHRLHLHPARVLVYEKVLPHRVRAAVLPVRAVRVPVQAIKVQVAVKVQAVEIVELGNKNLLYRRGQ